MHITEARTDTEEKFKQSGLSFSLSNPVIDALQGAANTAQALGNTGDGRTQALGLAVAALQGKQVVDAVQAIVNNPAAAAGIGINISLGSSKSQSNSEVVREGAQGSSVVAGRDVMLNATPSYVRPEPVEGHPDPGSILIQGSQVKAAQVATLNAEGDVDLVAATSTTQESSRSKNSSASVGFSLGSQTGVTVAASAGKGYGSGQESVHSNTRVEAGEQVRIKSGADTTLRGAVVAAPQVQADVGGDLRIQSLQDTSVFHEQSKQTGGSVTFGPAPGASISLSKSRANSDFTSVGEQSGFKAGDGGFQVGVQGNTELIGGAITSNQSAEENDLNQLDTGTLSSRDLQNSSNASANSSGINLSSDMASQGKYGAAKAVIGNALNNASEAGSSSGQTLATVSVARVTITNEAEQKALTGQSAEEAVASLNRDVRGAHVAAQKLDVRAMQERVEAERAIKQETIKAVTALTDAAYRSRMQQAPKLLKVECPSGQDCSKSPELLVRSEMTREEIAKAEPGSIIAVNGILNDERRASELAFQNTEPVRNPETNKPEKMQTVYLMHVSPADNTVSELLGVAYEKIVASADYGLANFLGYTNAQTLYADLLKSRGQEATISLGHSRGTLVQEAAFTILANQTDAEGNSYTNPNLVVRGVGGAANAEAYSEKAATVLGPDGQKNQITFNYFSNDPVATSNLSGSNPGVWTVNDLWQIFKTNNSMHSCYGTGAVGCTQVEIPTPGGHQGTPEGNAKLIRYEGGVRVDKSYLHNEPGNVR